MIFQLYRQQRIRVYQWKILIDFFVVLMLVFVLGMLTTLAVSDLYGSNNQAVSILTTGHSPDDRDFKDIFNRTQ